MKSIYAGCRFNPVKIGTALYVRGLHWKIEPVSMNLVLNCFVTVRYFFCVLQYRYLFTQFFRITSIILPFLLLVLHLQI
jgi:hypothetical protein